MNAAVLTQVADDDEDEEPKISWLKRALIAVVAVALVVGFVFMVRGFLDKQAAKKNAVHNVSLIKQPPPPPPKPPEKPPEPPKIKDEVKINEPPKPADAKSPDDKPSSDKPLALDAAGGAGSDGFGLAGRIGGKDLLSTGSGGGAYYSGLIQKQFFEALSKNRKLLEKEFRVVVRIWFNDDGKVHKTEITSGSGNQQVDEMIQATLLDMQALKEVPPAAMRPVQLRLSNR
jgi:protein TonB